MLLITLLYITVSYYLKPLALKLNTIKNFHCRISMEWAGYSISKRFPLVFLTVIAVPICRGILCHPLPHSCSKNEERNKNWKQEDIGKKSFQDKWDKSPFFSSPKGLKFLQWVVNKQVQSNCYLVVSLASKPWAELFGFLPKFLCCPLAMVHWRSQEYNPSHSV